MRVVAAPQMVLELGLPAPDRWSRLPEPARAQVLALLARMIAREVFVSDDPTGGAGPGDDC